MVQIRISDNAVVFRSRNGMLSYKFLFWKSIPRWYARLNLTLHLAKVPGRVLWILASKLCEHCQIKMGNLFQGSEQLTRKWTFLLASLVENRFHNICGVYHTMSEGQFYGSGEDIAGKWSLYRMHNLRLKSMSYDKSRKSRRQRSI